MAAGISGLPWLTFLKVAIGPNMLFPTLAHSTNRSCSATTASFRSGSVTPHLDRLNREASRKPSPPAPRGCSHDPDRAGQGGCAGHLAIRGPVSRPERQITPAAS
jgi:hypothetical protein